MPKGIYKRKPITEEHRLHLSLARIGKKYSEEHRKNISLSLKGRVVPPHVYSKVYSKELNEQRSRKLKGHIAWNKGIKLSAETRRKISEGHKGEKNYLWKGGKPNCIDCNKKLSTYASVRCDECARKINQEENHYKWKGNDVGYGGLHRWVKKWLGKPCTCEFCGKTGLKGRQIHWANKSQEYKRDLNDWLRLCVSCHKSYDSRKLLTNNLLLC